MDQKTEDKYLVLFKCVNPRQHEDLRDELDQRQKNGIDCLQILRKYDALGIIHATNQSIYKYDFQADFRSLKEVFKGTAITDDDIQTTLKILTGVPNPAMVAAKLLLHKIDNQQSVDRKRTASFNGVPTITKHSRLEVEGVIDLDASEVECNALEDVAVPPSGSGESNETYSATNDRPRMFHHKMIIPVYASEEASSETPHSSIDLSLEDDAETNEAASARAPEVLPVDERLVRKVKEMFPDVLPNFLNQICQGKTYNDATFAEVLDRMLETDYPKAPPRPPSPIISVSHEEQLTMLKEMLPDADPTFLESKVHELGDNKAALDMFLENILATKTYPTKKEYLRRMQLSAQQRQYTTEFNVQRFVELFPDPQAVFEAPDRKTPMPKDNDYVYVYWFMRKLYPRLYARDVQAAQHTSKYIGDMMKILDEHLAAGNVKKSKCASSRIGVDCQNIPLLQELSYIEHKQEIRDYIAKKKQQEAEDRVQAKNMGLLQTCSCCFDEEIMPNDIVSCPAGCRFCKFCVKRSSEIAVSEGKLNFPCLSGNCNTEFSLQVLQSVLEPKLFSKMAQKKAVAEVKAALLDELDSCPFCDFANIPAPDDKLFRCLNPDCMKESCRLCKEPSHVPLRCDEVEKDEHVKARTYIENKMTDALLRECWKCGNRFYKEEGCNKMTCVCGAKTCYVCRRPVDDYTHFNGTGGDRHDLCPLYTDNFTVNENLVLKAAAIAKEEVGAVKLKNDPTAHLQDQLKVNQQRVRPIEQRMVRPLEGVLQRDIPRLPHIQVPFNRHINHPMFLRPPINFALAYQQLQNYPPPNHQQQHHM